MTRTPAPPTIPSTPGQPTWELARQFPLQGDWAEDEYLALADRILIEFVDGSLEFPPMPTQTHQRIVRRLARILLDFVEPRRLGEVLTAPFRVKVRPGKYREPDLALMLRAHAARQHEQYWDGADLVVEVLSPDDPQRDLVVKRREYAEAGIPEYWIVDPERATVTVLGLQGKAYVERGIHGIGARAESALLPGLAVEVGALLAPSS